MAPDTTLLDTQPITLPDLVDLGSPTPRRGSVAVRASAAPTPAPAPGTPSPGAAPGWEPDLLGEAYERLTLPLGPDDERAGSDEGGGGAQPVAARGYPF